ncbi:MAG: TVP38/TMEM64 family protein [Alphaproteobacteria bacterium]|nr:MAG: TVP38/TMEM64 family protein [Alphaproteobacteria bacterium]
MAGGHGTGRDGAGGDGATPGAARRLSVGRLLPLLLIAAVAVTAGIWGSGHVGFETLREHRAALIAFRDAHPLAAAALYALLYVALVAFSLPGGVWMTLAGGFLFGAVAATALTVVAATAGATILFLAARHGLGAALHARLAGQGGRIARMERALRRNEASVLLLMRLVPAVPFFVANLAPAFLGVRTTTFVWTTFLGIIPGTAVYAWLGAGLGGILDAGGRPDLGVILSWPVLGPILALCALAALPMVIRALRAVREG